MKKIIMITLILSIVVLGGCVNSFDSCMSICKNMERANYTDCSGVGFTEAWENSVKCNDRAKITCFDKCS